ncbi:Phosphatase DCR2 [Apiospora kogelbergensis]|uniref:Phosphatase DCR2 n=2 Tax=Apiospora TaxID=1811811 RepID=A0AAW0QKM2_9PEZI
MATSSTPLAVVPDSVVTDLTICVFQTVSSPVYKPDSRIWHRIEKDLNLYTSPQSAWLYVAVANKEELAAEDLLVVDISVGDPPTNPGSGRSWESRPGGIWVLRSSFSDIIDQAVTEVDVLFGIDAIDP